jgi:hypothetical protein
VLGGGSEDEEEEGFTGVGIGGYFSIFSLQSKHASKAQLSL